MLLMPFLEEPQAAPTPVPSRMTTSPQQAPLPRPALEVSAGPVEPPTIRVPDFLLTASMTSTSDKEGVHWELRDFGGFSLAHGRVLELTGTRAKLVAAKAILEAMKAAREGIQAPSPILRCSPGASHMVGFMAVSLGDLLKSVNLRRGGSKDSHTASAAQGDLEDLVIQSSELMAELRPQFFIHPGA